jgi:hypothetical protein
MKTAVTLTIRLVSKFLLGALAVFGAGNALGMAVWKSALMAGVAAVEPAVRAILQELATTGTVNPAEIAAELDKP